MMRFLPVLVGVAAVAASAIDSGRSTNRWGNSADLDAIAERVTLVKPELGDWTSEPHELDARQLKVAGVTNYISRHYTNRKTGAAMQVLLICGLPGPISVHEPTVCYTSAGFAQAGPIERVAVGPDEFKAGRFVKGSPNPDSLRILWAWTTDGRFQIPDNPRWAFGRGTPALFKLYVIRHTGPHEGADKKDPSVEFLDVFLPELKRCLAPTS
jgi:hypothetical protein